MDNFDAAVSVVDRRVRKANAADGDGFWRKDEPIFDPKTGQIIKGGMFSHQREWWDLPNFIKLLVGGFGAGKTGSLSKRVMASSFENAPCAVACVSPTYNIARQTTIAALADYAEGKKSLYGRRHFWWQYNQSSHEFRMRHKGRNAKILIYSGDNPLSLRGPNLAAAFIDEPFIQDEEVFNQMVARVRHPRARHMEIGLSGTPEQLNWGYDLVNGELGERHDVGYVQASTRLNKALDPTYTERLLASYTEKAAAAYVEGLFVNLSTGVVYYGFDPLENVADLGIPDEAELAVGMDFNVDPMAAVVFWTMEGHCHIVEELELPNADTEYMCVELRERYGDRIRYIYPDPAGRSRHTNSPGAKTDFSYIRAAGYEINSRPPGLPHRKDRYNAVNGKFKPKNGRISLTVSPACKKLVGYCQQYTHELMNRDKQKKMSHLLDALGYPIEYLFPVDSNSFAIKPLVGA